MHAGGGDNWCFNVGIGVSGDYLYAWGCLLMVGGDVLWFGHVLVVGTVVFWVGKCDIGWGSGGRRGVGWDVDGWW